MPTFDETMAELESYGTATNRRIYARHGAGEPMFGVSFANLNAMRKRIKTDHALAQQLWVTGNHDARILATMIADPKKAASEELDQWAHDLDNYGLADALSKFTANTVHAREKAELWSQEEGEWISTAGWNLIGQLALKDKKLPDSLFEPYIEQIEREIHDRPNRTRYAMNGALIAMGGRSSDLEINAMATANAIGEVYVDHGETGCETPDACTYIEKAVARKGHLLKA